MVLSARSTLNVLKADTLPRSTNSVTYLQQAGRQKHKNRHTQKGLTTLSNNEPTRRDRKMEIPRETERYSRDRPGRMVGGSETETSSTKKRKSDGRSCSHGNKLEIKSSQSESHQHTRSSSFWVLRVFFGLKNQPNKLSKSNFIFHFNY